MWGKQEWFIQILFYLRYAVAKWLITNRGISAKCLNTWRDRRTYTQVSVCVCVCVCVCEWKRESEDSLWRCSQWELQVCWLICFLWKSYFWKPVEDSKEMQITSWKNLSAWERKKVEGGLFYFVDVDMNARCLFMPW